MNNEALMRRILDRIRSYDHIVISRHRRPDGDAIGSTMGLQAILRASFPEKTVLLVGEDKSEYMAFCEVEDPQPSDEFYRDALLIVLDTAGQERLSNRKADLAREIIKIDHHIDVAPYGDISWVEDERSSVCEMIAAFCLAFPDELKMTREAATYLFIGMVTDSGRFHYNSTSGDTMRLAGYLLDQGIDTDVIYAQLDLEDYSVYAFKTRIYQQIRRSPSGVLSIFIPLSMQAELGLSAEMAANCISYLQGIRGSLIWLAFIEYPDGSLRVRLRSRFVAVNQLGEKYHGGGHANAAGATVYSMEEAEALLADAEKIHKEFKETTTGWL